MNYQNENEFFELKRLVGQLKPLASVLEIGSLHGETLISWMKICEGGSTLVSIDMIVPPADPRYRMQKDGHQVFWPRAAIENAVTLFVLDDNSTEPHTVLTVKSLLPSIDFLFIDGGHDYQTCKSDWENYGPLVRPGGIVAFHDLGHEWPDVRKVWEVARQGKRSLELVESAHRFGIGVLYV